MPSLDGRDGPTQFTFHVGDEEHLAVVMPCEFEGITWYVGATAPASTFLGPAREQRTTSAVVGGGALLLAIALALLLARRLTRSQALVDSARAKARERSCTTPSILRAFDRKSGLGMTALHSSSWWRARCRPIKPIGWKPPSAGWQRRASGGWTHG